MLVLLLIWLLTSCLFIRIVSGNDKPHPDVIVAGIILPFVLSFVLLVYIEIYLEELGL